MEVYTEHQARESLLKIMDYATKMHRPVYIQNSDQEVVVLSGEDYRSLQETLYLKSIPGMEASLLKARSDPPSHFSETLE